MFHGELGSRYYDAFRRKMTDPVRPQKFSVPTVLGGRREVICPICGHNEFLGITPDMELAKREGFRHVIMGVYGTDRLAAMSVRFRHCANCGYILKFVIGRLSEGEAQ
jgi:hypothetical protein